MKAISRLYSTLLPLFSIFAHYSTYLRHSHYIIPSTAFVALVRQMYEMIIHSNTHCRIHNFTISQSFSILMYVWRNPDHNVHHIAIVTFTKSHVNRRINEISYETLAFALYTEQQQKIQRKNRLFYYFSLFVWYDSILFYCILFSVLLFGCNIQLLNLTLS